MQKKNQLRNHDKSHRAEKLVGLIFIIVTAVLLASIIAILGGLK